MKKINVKEVLESIVTILANGYKIHMLSTKDYPLTKEIVNAVIEQKKISDAITYTVDASTIWEEIEKHDNEYLWKVMDIHSVFPEHFDNIPVYIEEDDSDIKYEIGWIERPSSLLTNKDKELLEEAAKLPSEIIIEDEPAFKRKLEMLYGRFMINVKHTIPFDCPIVLWEGDYYITSEEFFQKMTGFFIPITICDVMGDRHDPASLRVEIPFDEEIPYKELIVPMKKFFKEEWDLNPQHLLNGGDKIIMYFCK